MEISHTNAGTRGGGGFNTCIVHMFLHLIVEWPIQDSTKIMCTLFQNREQNSVGCHAQFVHPTLYGDSH